MSIYHSWFVKTGLALLFLGVAAQAAAQPDNVNFRFNSGQPVQPIYEGWERRPDGTIAMYFGYINRNYAQTLAIPIGPANGFAPGPADRGQPTVFHNRIHRQIFSVKVPATWGKTQELTWTVTANGATLKAVGWLQPEWEVDSETGGQMQNEEARANKAPTLAVTAPGAATLASPVTLTATVVDDGLPKPPGKRAPIAGVAAPTLQPNPGDPEIPVNVPQATDPGRGRRVGSSGLSVSWVVWRGPAAADFAPQATASVKDGQAVVTARFTQPGTYVLKATASDGARSSEVKEIAVTVTP
jgi:hypothetical protein